MTHPITPPPELVQQWIKGGPEADRETARMIGRHEVVNHILQQMTKATT